MTDRRLIRQTVELENPIFRKTQEGQQTKRQTFKAKRHTDNRCTDIPPDRQQTERQADGQTYGQTNKHTNGRSDSFFTMIIIVMYR